MKVEIKAAGVERYMIDTIKLSDRLNDIAGWIDVVHLAIEGAAAELDTPLLGPVMTFVSEIRAQIAAVSDEICPGPTPPMAAAEGEQAGVAA
jgi:hypothetical protein